MTPPDANGPWDGCWRIPKPDDYTPGLYRWHQVVAFDLLRSGAALTHWEAELLQVIAYQARDLSVLQRFWLARIEREHERLAA